MPQFQYQAVRLRQTHSSDWVVLFAAPATEIDTWAGVPQKKKIGEQETTGFQREESKKRIREISSFYQNKANIVQNPLLCALREKSIDNIVFEAIDVEGNVDSSIQLGLLKINAPCLEEQSLLKLLQMVKDNLENRLPELKAYNVSDELVRQLKQQTDIYQDSAIHDEDVEDDDDIYEEAENKQTYGLSLDESHIVEFWEEISACVAILMEIESTKVESDLAKDEFLGYSKEALISFLRPIVLVDGQHRLRAAIQAVKDTVNEDDYKEEIDRLILEKEIGAEEARIIVETKAARNLPVSLLMNTDPAEHVFQFVVVNQKATPVKNALLGTIVSTSLSNRELERVADRLENAGIKLEESRAVSYLSRYKKSPFHNLVDRGLSSDTKDRLKWNVLAGIVKIFRELEGGRLFHQNVDYAAKWKEYNLEQSEIVQGWEEEGYKSAFEYWRKLDGVWRDVFVEFWAAVRDKLAEKEEKEAWHYWGSPRKSNIFNKISLTILAADFFQFLSDREIKISKAQVVPQIVDEWLKGVNVNYFNRDWDLHGVKKDIPGIRKKWSEKWVEYRKYPKKLPPASTYRIASP